MMTKEEHINYWINNAQKDWRRAKRCFNDKDYLFCLFCLHLSLEKIIKGLWVKYNHENFPPKIHNLVKLLEQTLMKLQEDEIIFLTDLNKFQLEGRYPDYRNKIYKVCTKEFTKKTMLKAEIIKKCLLKELQ